MTEQMSLQQAYQWLEQLPNDSIYDGSRLAQPDEVANYKVGDGLEKAFLLANVIRHRMPEQQITMSVDKSRVTLKAQQEYNFSSQKGLEKVVDIPAAG